MEPHEDDGGDAEEFFETLAGRAAGHPGAVAMRAALQARARTIQDADAARRSELDVMQLAEMDAVKRRLIEAGLLSSGTRPLAGRTGPGSSPDIGAARHPLGVLLFGLRDALLGQSWHRPAAIAVAVVMVSAVVLQLGAPRHEEDPSAVLRGGGGSDILVEDAATTTRLLRERLTASGAEVLVVQLNSSAWAVRVNVPDAARADAVRRQLGEAGFKPQGAPPFEVVVRQRP